MTRLFGVLVPVSGLRCCVCIRCAGCCLTGDAVRVCWTGVTVASVFAWVLDRWADTGVPFLGAAAVLAAATRLAEATRVPPLALPPLSETIRVDNIGVLPPGVIFEPSCKGIIAF